MKLSQDEANELLGYYGEQLELIRDLNLTLVAQVNERKRENSILVCLVISLALLIVTI